MNNMNIRCIQSFSTLDKLQNKSESNALQNAEQQEMLGKLELSTVAVGKRKSMVGSSGYSKAEGYAKKSIFSPKKLDRISRYPLTIVEAPSGFGKTTAVMGLCHCKSFSAIVENLFKRGLIFILGKCRI